MKSELKELIGLTKQHIIDLKKSGITSVPATSRRAAKAVSCKKMLEQFREEIQNCKKCSLSKTRTKFVFGDGSQSAELIFIGEAPGYDEDQKGIPFVGRAGQLLTKIIEAMKFKRDDVYICNVLKCRPPDNRAPQPDEIALCKPYLETQLSLLGKKKIICCLGLYAAQNLLGLDLPMKEMRGNWYSYNGTPVIVTYHPAYLLRNPPEKKKVWDDMQRVLECLRK